MFCDIFFGVLQNFLDLSMSIHKRHAGIQCCVLQRFDECCAQTLNLAQLVLLYAQLLLLLYYGHFLLLNRHIEHGFLQPLKFPLNFFRIYGGILQLLILNPLVTYLRRLVVLLKACNLIGFQAGDNISGKLFLHSHFF